MTRPAPPMQGLLVVDKPIGCSSMDVVRRVRRSAGGKHIKTGHAGTLDPLASGVLICCLGREATRLVESLMELPKVYQTTIDLSAFSTTDDLEGQLQPVDVPHTPAESQVRAALDQFLGEIEQTPPAHSAVKIKGQPAYKLARRGEAVKLRPRIIRIDSIDLLGYDWPKLEIVVTCGRGTYIRSLARQIGEALGTGGHLTALRRTAIGPFTADQAIHLDSIPDPLPAELLLDAERPW